MVGSFNNFYILISGNTKKKDKNYVYVTHHHGWENFFLDAQLFGRTILLASPDRALKKGLSKPVYVR